MSSRTRKMIIDSFVRLLEERPVKKISVKDIVEDCGINRNTFYYHFADIPALAEEIVRSEAENVARTAVKLNSLEECVELAMRHCRDHNRAIWHIYNSASREICERYLMEICEHVVTVFIDDLPEARELEALDRAAIVEGYKCELYGFINDWLQHNMDEQVERQFLRLCVLREGMVEQMIARALNLT